MTVIVWFKRDLRVEDHPALARASGMGPILPLYILEPGYWALPDTSRRQFDFLRESLEDVNEALARKGAALCLRVGDAREVLEQVRRETGAEILVSHEETGNAWTFERDKAIADWAKSSGVAWHELPQSGVVRRLGNRDGWAKARNAYLRAPFATVPERIEAVCLPSDDLKQMGAGGPCIQRQTGGRAHGLSVMGGFLTERGKHYRKDMSSPLTGETSCSRLSPYLALGCLSGREASQAGAVRQREVKGTREGWGGSLKSFQARLAWRDHFMQKLEDEPALETRCLHSAYEDLRPRVPDPVRLAAWEAGETGLPFVDACMRYLNATGWLNFRMRSMLMAVASYHLWLDWRVTGLHLARQFTDYEPGIHWPQSQMQSGTTGMNTVRIYNPVKQGRDQDPNGTFTRRWVPELAHVPDKHLQEPWRWDGAGQLLGRTYPEPLVDVVAAARVAREKVWAVRTGAAFRGEAARVVKKHASRKDPQNHFVNDREPAVKRGRGSDPRQGSFEF